MQGGDLRPMSDKRGVIELSDDNFDDVVFSNQDPVLVEFWSEGSYACRELDGVIERLAQEYTGKVRIGRLDVESSWQTAHQFGVTNAPMVLVFQNQRVVDRIQGVQSATQYRQAINEVVVQHWTI